MTTITENEPLGTTVTAAERIIERQPLRMQAATIHDVALIIEKETGLRELIDALELCAKVLEAYPPLTSGRDEVARAAAIAAIAKAKGTP